MSNIFDSKNLVKKIESVLDEVSKLTTEYSPKLKDQLNKLLHEFEQLEKVKNEDQQKIASNADEINTLKSKIMQKEHDILRLEENIEGLNKEKQDLLNRIQSAQNELNETHEQIKLKSEELENRNLRLKELETNIGLLTKELSQFDEKLKLIETELENTFFRKRKFVESYENRVKAMKKLIGRGYISSAQYQFIKALQKGSVLDIKNIIVAIDMREEQARKVLRKMVEENGPIEYNETAGTVKLLQEVEF
jgi:chromosome segregation ATPase